VGIWTRAPYIHNGSVPTLYHVLVPSERPAKFSRGSVSYDTAKVGYQWEFDKLAALHGVDPTVSVFDTTWDSSSNGGHNKNLTIDAAGNILHAGWDGTPKAGESQVRLDWSGPENKDAVADLLEFLKTL
jgi:hypothetical protein